MIISRGRVTGPSLLVNDPASDDRRLDRSSNQVDDRDVRERTPRDNVG
jgi:hypothetical protein